MRKELAFLMTYSLGRTHDDGSDFDEQPFLPNNVRADWARSRQSQVHRFSASAVFEIPEERLEWMPKALREAMDKLSFAPIFSTGSGRPINALDSTDAFRTGAYPISARPFGLPRNPFFSPATFSLDLRVARRFPFKHNRAWFNLGAEMFNLTNHSNFLRVSPYYATGGLRLPSYRNAVETLNARQIQLLLTLEY